MSETIIAPEKDSAVSTAFPEFVLPAEKPTETPAPAETAASGEPATENPAPAAEEKPAEAGEQKPAPEKKPENTLEKRLRDTQTAMHEAAKKAKIAEAKLEKAAKALLKQVEDSGVELTDEEQQLAFDDPAALAKVYGEKLAAKKADAAAILELAPEEQAKIDEEFQQETAKTRDQVVEEAWTAACSEYPDMAQVITPENIKRFFTDMDREELEPVEDDRERFIAGYKKLKAYIAGVEKAKQKMKEGEENSGGPSLSKAGVATPDMETANITMQEAWETKL